MSHSFNTTGNKFYETVNFDKGSNAKGLLLPTENAKADLGSPTKKYDKLYVNDIPGRSKEITRGTWRPIVRWSTNSNRYVRPTFSTPTVTTIEAKYERIGNRVFCFYMIGAIRSTQRQYSDVFSDVGGLPFEIYQRTAKLDSGIINLERSILSNPFVYDYTQFILTNDNIYANWTDSTRRSVVRTSLYAIRFRGDLRLTPNRYYYARFAYRTR